MYEVVESFFHFLNLVSKSLLAPFINVSYCTAETCDVTCYFLHRCGSLFVLDDEGVKCVAVVVALNAEECELKNIATYPEHQNKGYGKAMVDYLSGRYLGEFETMYVGTGDVPKILRFYERCGFRISHRDENFFIDNYDHPMFEDGVQLRDMVYLRKDV